MNKQKPTIDQEKVIIYGKQIEKTQREDKNIPEFYYFEALLKQFIIGDVIKEMIHSGMNLGKYEIYYIEKIIEKFFDPNCSPEISEELISVYCSYVEVTDNLSLVEILKCGLKLTGIQSPVIVSQEFRNCFPLMMKNNMKSELKYIYDQAFAMFDTVHQRAALKAVEFLQCIFHENNKIDTKSEIVQEIYDFLSEIKYQEEDDSFGSIWILSDYMKYDCRKRLSKVISLCTTTFRKTSSKNITYGSHVNEIDCMLLFLQIFGSECEQYLSKSTFVENCLSVLQKSDNMQLVGTIYLILFELCYIRSPSLELQLGNIYNSNEKYEPKNLGQTYFDTMVLYYFEYEYLKPHVDLLINKSIDAIFDEEFMEKVEDKEYQIYSQPILAIGILTKIDFEKVDKRFEEFGNNFIDAIKIFKKYLTDYEIDYLYDALFSLIKNNMNFSSTNIFPNINIQNLVQKSQIHILMSGGNFFDLLPELINCQDVNFKFQ
eukprot:gene7832-12306_t